MNVFKRWSAKRKVMRYLWNNKGDVTIKPIGSLTPWKYIRSEKPHCTLYAVMVSRGMSVCPLLVEDVRKAHSAIRQEYRDRLNAENMRGYHAGVREVSRL